MTYCVGLKIDRGLVFMSDTRTNAGMDSISTFKKMHVWEEPGERVIVLMSAGNLATSLAETVKLLLVSFDSTLKSNLSVGLPLDLLFLEKDALKVGLRKRFGQDDQYYRAISEGWSNALKAAFGSLPDFPG